MTTTRKPITRKRTQITPQAVAIFHRMQALEKQCTCGPQPPPSKEYWKDRPVTCPACKEWWEQNELLRDELHLRPWEEYAYKCTGDPHARLAPQLPAG
jgi:hypothetical protein